MWENIANLPIHATLDRVRGVRTAARVPCACRRTPFPVFRAHARSDFRRRCAKFPCRTCAIRRRASTVARACCAPCPITRAPALRDSEDPSAKPSTTAPCTRARTAPSALRSPTPTSVPAPMDFQDPPAPMISTSVRRTRACAAGVSTLQDHTSKFKFNLHQTKSPLETYLK